MSEQKERFTEELDRWTDEKVIEPILDAMDDVVAGEKKPDEADFGEVKKAIRERVFDSYRAGCRATEKKLGVKSRKRREKED